MPPREGRSPRVPHQQSLFRVIPFDAIAAASVNEQGDRRLRPKRPTAQFAHPDQDYLPFAETAAPATVSRPAIECDARVARISRRMRAGGIDLAVVFIGVCVFAGVFRAVGGPFAFDQGTLLITGVASGLILLVYGLLCCLLSDRSPGMRIAGSRLLHFHGRPATRRQRLLRLAASILSLLPAGIGYWWALLDEERLTFHDQISGTFPSPE
jgi:uncharacterized RDD family membrane protein YckC